MKSAGSSNIVFISYFVSIVLFFLILFTSIFFKDLTIKKLEKMNVSVVEPQSVKSVILYNKPIITTFVVSNWLKENLPNVLSFKAGTLEDNEKFSKTIFHQDFYSTWLKIFREKVYDPSINNGYLLRKVIIDEPNFLGVGVKMGVRFWIFSTKMYYSVETESGAFNNGWKTEPYVNNIIVSVSESSNINTSGIAISEIKIK